MRYMMVAAVGLAVTGYTLQVQATELTGQELFEYCKKTTGAENLMCTAYIAGYTDGVTMGEPLSLKMTGGTVCLPHDIDVAITRARMMKWAQTEPNLLNRQARLVLAGVLSELFPCGK